MIKNEKTNRYRWYEDKSRMEEGDNGGYEAVYLAFKPEKIEWIRIRNTEYGFHTKDEDTNQDQTDQ